MKRQVEPGIKLFLSAPGGEGVFGDGKWALLRAVRDIGSLRGAAKALGRGYRKAWGDIRETEEAMGRRLLIMSRGGHEGGSARLTPFGECLLEAWEKYRDELDAAMIRSYERHLKNPIEGEKGDTDGQRRA